MAKKSKAPAAVATAEAAADEMGVSSAQSSAHGSEGSGEKEGAFLLGQPTWEDAGGGRWRCAETGHELPEREKEAYGRSRSCRLALIDHAVARKKPPLNAFKPHPEHKSKLVCNITGDTINKSEEHVWKHINGKRFLNKLDKLEEQMVSAEKANEETAKSNEVAKKGKSSKKDKKGKEKTNVASPLPQEHKPEMKANEEAAKSNEVAKKGKSSKKDKKGKKKTNVASPLPQEPKPEMDDSGDPEFWVPPVGSRWDDDDGKDRWESSPGKNEGSSDAYSSGCGDNDDDDNDEDMTDKDDAESRELSSRTKRMSSEAVGPSSFASRKKKPKKEQ